MKEPLYRQAITFSWQIAWKHKILWPLGLLAAFLGHMGLSQIFTQMTLATTGAPWYAGFLSILLRGDTSVVAGQEFIGTLDAWIWLFWLIGLLLAIGILFLIAGSISQGALIHLFAKASSSRTRKLPALEKSWAAGVSHKWRLLGLAIGRRVIMWALAIMVGWATFNVLVSGTSTDMWVFLLMFVLTVVFGVFISFLTMYAANYIVVEDKSISDALHDAWRLCVDHWLVSLEAAIVVLSTYLVLFVVALIGMFVLFMPTMALWYIALTVGSAGLFMFGFATGILSYTVLVVLLGSIFTVFTTGIWTFLFMKMHKKGIKSRIVHWAGY